MKGLGQNLGTVEVHVIRNNVRHIQALPQRETSFSKFDLATKLILISYIQRDGLGQ